MISLSLFNSPHSAVQTQVGLQILDYNPNLALYLIEQVIKQDSLNKRRFIRFILAITSLLEDVSV